MATTVKSTELFNMIASKKYNRESDRQMQLDYLMNTNKEMERGEIIGSAEPVYQGRRMIAFMVESYPNKIEFKLIKGEA